MLETNYEKSSGCSFTIPLGTKAHELARKCSQAVCNTDKDKNKVERVYLNSLAVYAVDFYLKFLGFETDLEESNSQDKLMLQFLTEADLPVKNIGRFECIPIKENTEHYNISLEVSCDRIGYIIVKLNASQREAVVLGFIKTYKPSLNLNQLHSVDDLIDYLSDKKEEVAAKNIP